MTSVKKFSIEDEGYFGVSFLGVGEYGADLMKNRVMKTIDTSNLHFDDATANYHREKSALTVEGNAVSISTPRFAIESLSEYARIARDFDVLGRAQAS